MRGIRLVRHAEPAGSPEMPLRTGAVTRLDDPPLELAPAAWRFRDRTHAGRRLAVLMEQFRDERPMIVAMPRGGVPVAAEVARSLGAPLDVAVVRKIGAPHNPQYAIGAVAEGGVQILERSLARKLGLSEEAIRGLITDAERELSARTQRYRGTREPLEVAGRTVILVDDGLATGRSARAAIRSLRERGAARVILAVPVAAPESVEALRLEADEVVCVEMPEDLWAVGLWYDDFRQTTDEEVTALLSDYAPQDPAQEWARGGHDAPRFEPDRPHEVSIGASENVSLAGEVLVPEDARGIVLFAHGSGSGRMSPRNQAVARALNRAGYATLLFDLLTPGEERDRANVFDIKLLASRLVAASTWVAGEGALAELPLAYFGASTGAAAALSAAAECDGRVHAVISRGGRPDLALELSEVRAPTLLIVGGADSQVLELNRMAQRQLRCVNDLAVVPGATHLFEERGALERVADLAIEWLDAHVAPARARRADGARA